MRGIRPAKCSDWLKEGVCGLGCLGFRVVYGFHDCKLQGPISEREVRARDGFDGYVGKPHIFVQRHLHFEELLNTEW